jgi:hypothetical protein
MLAKQPAQVETVVRSFGLERNVAAHLPKGTDNRWCLLAGFFDMPDAAVEVGDVRQALR